MVVNSAVKTAVVWAVKMAELMVGKLAKHSAVKKVGKKAEMMADY